jgi:hypothetical protein
MLLNFIGGPFDGHAQDGNAQGGDLLAVALNENVNKLLAGEQRKFMLPIKKVALYQNEGNGRMKFVAIRPAHEYNLESWRF